MIEISSFSPLDNLARRSWIFGEENIILRTKSLSVDVEDEIKYEDIRIIQAGRVATLRGVWAAFILCSVLAVIDWLLGSACQDVPVLQFIERVGFIFGLAIMIPSLRKTEVYRFLDIDRDPLMYIPIRARDRQSIEQAIARIKQKTTLISDRGLDDPLPAAQPAFELIELDIPDFLNRSKSRFYTDRLIDTEKSLVEEAVTEVRFSELSGKTRVMRLGNAKWDYVWSYWLILVSMIGFLFIFFFPQLLRGNHTFLNLFLGAMLLLIPMFLMRYVKRDLQVFYNSHNQAIYWTPRTRSNREKLDQIIDFIQERVANLREDDPLEKA